MTLTEEFPQNFSCRRCRRSFLPLDCRIISNMFAGKVNLSCPRCRRRLFTFSIKDWYEKYIQTPESPPASERKIDLD
ncbi:MAG: hypothetical protein HYS22_03270 [Deltaproteobacteria bacterium]|nr:hypothetical protein [Deltaproteobacteria bacterium]